MRARSRPRALGFLVACLACWCAGLLSGRMGAARRCWWAIAAAVTALVARGTDAGQPATTTFFVALSGSDDNSGTARASAFKSLHRAQQAARLCRTAAGSARCAGMVSVQVGPGVHVLAAPLVFGPQDGSVSYERDSAAGAGAGAAAVVVSSGLQVSGWAPVPAAPAWVVTDLGSAPAAALISRHLWVNGRRADRTEVPGATGPRRPAIWHQAWEEEPKAAVRWLNTTDKTGARRQTCSSTGFVLKPGAEAEAALAWPDVGSGVELVFQGVFPAPWAEPRCAVLNVSKTSTGGAHLTMAQPCHCSYVYKCLLMTGGKPTVHPPTAIVNAKTVSFPTLAFVLEIIILPRQARDKHREPQNRETVSSGQHRPAGGERIHSWAVVAQCSAEEALLLAASNRSRRWDGAAPGGRPFIGATSRCCERLTAEL